MTNECMTHPNHVYLEALDQIIEQDNLDLTWSKNDPKMVTCSAGCEANIPPVLVELKYADLIPPSKSIIASWWL